MSESPRLSLLFDPECELCLQFQQTVGEWDEAGMVERIALNDPALVARLTAEELEAAREELTVIDRLGNHHHGIQALRRLTDVLPGVRRLSWAYQLPGVTPLVAGVYRAVARRRKAGRPCLNCGQKWMPSMKWSRRGRGRR